MSIEFPRRLEDLAVFQNNDASGQSVQERGWGKEKKRREGKRIQVGEHAGLHHSKEEEEFWRDWDPKSAPEDD